MLTETDLNAIDGLLNKRIKPIEETLKDHTGKLMEIERDIGAALELRKDVSEFREQIQDQQERISELENPEPLVN